MSEKIVVGYDDSEASKNALAFAVDLANARGDAIVIAHVLEWSPYSFLTPEELEERHKRRQDELQRAEEVLLGPVRAKLADAGVEAETVSRYGHIAETLANVTKETGAKQIIVGRTGHSGLSSRIFGSVAGTLAQVATVPVTIVP